MLIFFGPSGDPSYLDHLITANGYHTEVVAHDQLVGDKWTVDFTFLISFEEAATAPAD
jgi:hypothetical protein